MEYRTGTSNVYLCEVTSLHRWAWIGKLLMVKVRWKRITQTIQPGRIHHHTCHTESEGSAAGCGKFRQKPLRGSYTAIQQNIYVKVRFIVLANVGMQTSISALKICYRECSGVIHADSGKLCDGTTTNYQHKPTVRIEVKMGQRNKMATGDS